MRASACAAVGRKLLLPLCAGALLAVVPTRGAAQIPEKFENLKVLPKDISRDSLVTVMRGFTFALGVRCSFCHVEKKGSPRQELDFKADDKETKRKARFMLRMVQSLNDSVLTRLPDRSDPPVRVTCVTCHRGSELPKTIETVLTEAIDSAGVEAAVQRYRELREKTMPLGRYNFGEEPVNQLAGRLSAQGKTDEVLALLRMNEEFYPNSAAVEFEMGEVYRARGDRDQAIVHYRTALEKDPNNRFAQRRLQELTGTPK